MDATYQTLLETAREQGLKITDERFAQLLDERDPLKHFREQFHIPTKVEALEGDLADGEFQTEVVLNALYISIDFIDSVPESI